MMLGIGVDAVEVERVRRAVQKSAGSFAQKVFTQAERRYCLAQAKPWESFAARFAAKEAVLKALKVGVTPARLPEVEVKIARGQGPSVALSGVTKRAAAAQRVGRVWISLTHTADTAIAFAVAEKK